MIKKYIEESLKYLLRTRLFIHKYVDEINVMYDMTSEELKARNERRFLEIFRKAYSKSKYYRGLCLAEGIKSIEEIRYLKDIVKLPILTKDILKVEQQELRSLCFRIGHRCGENRLTLFVIGSGVDITMVNQWFLYVEIWGEVKYLLRYM